MRIRISHEAVYAYEQPVRSVTKALRVMPRDHEGQMVVSWRIEPSVDGRLRVAEDAFGNLVHSFQADGPFDALTISIHGLVETSDTTGFVRGTAEPVPEQIYLRDSAITQADEPMMLFARRLDRAGKSELEQLHMLMDALHHAIRLKPLSAGPAGKAAEAFGLRAGTTIDIAHMFCGCTRELGVPARLVAGYSALAGTSPVVGASHVWAEAMVPGFGWIGFDPSINLCPGARHVRVAVGIDHADAAPFRQARIGGGGESALSAVEVAEMAQ